VIAFVTAIGSEERYQRFARKGVDLTKAPEDVVLELRDASSLASAYNQALDELAAQAGLEAAIILHDDTEICDEGFRDKIRAWVAEPQTSIVGALGARRVSSIAWWLGDGVGRLRETRGTIDFGEREGDVDAVDGLLLALCTDAVRKLRFDERVAPGFHGYDVDVCFTARRHGGRVVVREMDIVHHTKGGFGDRLGFVRTDLRWRAKWKPRESPAARARHLVRLAGVMVPRGAGAEFGSANHTAR